MFALGIIGEYLARMHLRSMERPAYTIRRIAEHSQNAPVHPDRADPRQVVDVEPREQIAGVEAR